MFNLKKIYTLFFNFIKLDLWWWEFSSSNENEPIAPKPSSERTNKIPTCSSEYVFDVNGSIRNALEKLWIWDLYNKHQDIRFAFDEVFMNKNIFLTPWDVFKLDITSWKPVSNYNLSIIRNWVVLQKFDLTKAINTKKISIISECRSWLKDLALNIQLDQKNKINEKKWLSEKKNIISKCAKNPVQWEFCGETNAPISDTVKVLKELNIMESITLLKKIFWEWPWTELLINIDNGSTFAIKRMVTLAEHEWKLLFGRQNKDPRSWNNVWVFQIWWKNSTPRKSLNKYTKCLDAWVELAKEKWIKIDYESLINSPSQRDLIAHLWYINLERWWDKVLNELSNSNLSKKETTQLMSRKIQGWSSAIWKNIITMLNTKRIDISEINSSKKSA